MERNATTFTGGTLPHDCSERSHVDILNKLLSPTTCCAFSWRCPPVNAVAWHGDARANDAVHYKVRPVRAGHVRRRGCQLQCRRRACRESVRTNSRLRSWLEKKERDAVQRRQTHAASPPSNRDLTGVSIDTTLTLVTQQSLRRMHGSGAAQHGRWPQNLRGVPPLRLQLCEKPVRRPCLSRESSVRAVRARFELYARQAKRARLTYVRCASPSAIRDEESRFRLARA